MKIGNIEIFKKACDGGKDSGVTGYWLIEWKSVFSIVLLRFGASNRENFHNHAFNALTWWIKGKVIEKVYLGSAGIRSLSWKPSFVPKYTPRSNMHRIIPEGVAWCLSIRGPWTKTWGEYNPKTEKEITLTSGRRIVK